jgi:hypothetical protein
MTSGAHDGTRTAVLGGVLVALLASGWFVLSWRVAHNPAGDAFDESLGVGFAILIVVSIVRSVLHRNQSDDSQPDGNQPDGNQPDNADEWKGGTGG